MTLDKAIEILKDQHDYFYKHANPDIKDAVQLGIEALKYFQSVHHSPGHRNYLPLPGETRGVNDEPR